MAEGMLTMMRANNEWRWVGLEEAELPVMFHSRSLGAGMILVD